MDINNPILILSIITYLSIPMHHALMGLKILVVPSSNVGIQPIFRNHSGLYSKLLFLSAMFISINIANLALAYASNDLSFSIVAFNSNAADPLLYRIATIWSTHQGSILVWLFLAAVISWLLSLFVARNDTYNSLSLVFASSICGIMAIFLYFCANPFAKLIPAPTIGLGLNPALQDVALAIHPPILYLGYACTIPGYCLSVANMFAARNPLSWDLRKLNQLLKFWNWLSWSFISLGITLGSWWAYREVGWGGYWFWDPVENASLFPWLLNLAIIHSRNPITLSPWPFISTLGATFIVRSGMITSVHAFAIDNTTGLWIVIAILLSSLMAALAFACYKESLYNAAQSQNHKLIENAGYNPNSAHSNIYLYYAVLGFITSLLCIALGTLFPLLAGWQDTVIDRNFFDQVVNSIFSLSLFLCLWREMATTSRTSALMAISMGIFLSIALYFHCYQYQQYLGFDYCFALGLTTTLLTSLLISISVVKTSRHLFLRHYLNINIVDSFRARPTLGHFSIAVLALGISYSSIGSRHEAHTIQIGETIDFCSHNITLDDIVHGQADNHFFKRANIVVTGKDQRQHNINCEQRFFPISKQSKMKIGLLSTALYDLHIAMNHSTIDGKSVMYFHYRPLVSLIWTGGFLLFLVGIWSAYNMYQKLQEKHAHL